MPQIKPRVLLAFDPGKSWDPEKETGSFAYAVMVDGKIIQHGLLIPLVSVSDMDQPAVEFLVRIKALVAQFAPDMVLYELFQDRGGASKGTTGMCINAMMGLIAGELLQSGRHLVTVSPSLWKTWLTRTHGIGKKEPVKNLFEHFRATVPARVNQKGKANRAKRMVVHEGDAIGIALWAYQTKYQGQVDLANLLDLDAKRVIN